MNITQFVNSAHHHRTNLQAALEAPIGYSCIPWSTDEDDARFAINCLMRLYGLHRDYEAQLVDDWCGPFMLETLRRIGEQGGDLAYIAEVGSLILGPERQSYEPGEFELSDLWAGR